MTYCITMEKTQRIAIWYQADSNEDAISKGETILAKHQNVDSGFSDGDVEYYYAIDASDGTSILQWWS